MGRWNDDKIWQFSLENISFFAGSVTFAAALIMHQPKTWPLVVRLALPTLIVGIAATSLWVFRPIKE